MEPTNGTHPSTTDLATLLHCLSVELERIAEDMPDRGRSVSPYRALTSRLSFVWGGLDDAARSTYYSRAASGEQVIRSDARMLSHLEDAQNGLRAIESAISTGDAEACWFGLHDAVCELRDAIHSARVLISYPERSNAA